MSNPVLVYKTSTKAWVYNGDTDTNTQVTDVDYPGTHTYTISSLTSSSTTATATTSAAHGLIVGDSVTIAGATQTEYNGTYFVVTATDNTHFTYTFAGSATSPATGTITATDGRTTVPGIVYLDGTYYVMKADGTIYGSGIDDPFTWHPLNFITPEVEIDSGVAIAKYLNYLIAFGQWTTEFFYDAVEPAPASPLRRIDNMFLQIGCAHARSIAHTENTVIWMAQVKEGSAGSSAGRSIVSLSGSDYKVISTPFVERILNADALTTVYSYSFRWNGHSFYLLTLVASNITLVYDFTTGFWHQWTSMTIQATKSATLVYSTTTGLVTATVATHGYADGDAITIAGASPAAYNGTFNITYLTANTFAYTPASVPATTPATGTITAVGYTESYFKFVMHCVVNGVNMFLHESDGKLYDMAEDDYDDNGCYINFIVRTPNLDGGTNDDKRIARLELIGDRVDADAHIRYTKDDYVSFSNYRKVDLSLKRSCLNRIGKARRAAFDIRITDNQPIRLERLDITIEGEE